MALTGPGADPNGPEVEALVDYYRRVLMAMTVDRVYGEKLR